eukprot:4990804-Prymnesium_polylepis.1
MPSARSRGASCGSSRSERTLNALRQSTAPAMRLEPNDLWGCAPPSRADRTAPAARLEPNGWFPHVLSSPPTTARKLLRSRDRYPPLRHQKTLVLHQRLLQLIDATL